MPPSPNTPSPRRFITKKVDKSSSKSSSNLRFQVPAAHPLPPITPQTSSGRPTSAHQFAAAPKFSFEQPKLRDALPISPPKPNTPAVHNVWDRRPSGGEVIEDVSQEGHQQREENDNEMVLESTELAERDGDSPPSPKRRRLEDPRDNRVQSEHTTRSQLAIPSPILTQSTSVVNHATPRRFLAQTTVSPLGFSSGPHSEDSLQHFNRPAFLKPSAAPTEAAEPLPDAFSPHRRGQKFVPGGMASEVRQWIVDASQAATHSRSRRSSGEKSYVRVMESRGTAMESMVLARGSVEGKDVQLILPYASKKTASQLQPEEVLGVKAPTWEVELAGGTWVVAADWRLLKNRFLQ